MLKNQLNAKEDININEFLKLRNLIKSNSKGYKPRKSFVFKWEQLMKFTTEAVDCMYLAMKVINNSTYLLFLHYIILILYLLQVILIFGICALRCDEIKNMKISDVEELEESKFLVSIYDNKNYYPDKFIIGDLFFEKVKKYIQLRPVGEFSDRFFINYHKESALANLWVGTRLVKYQKI